MEIPDWKDYDLSSMQGQDECRRALETARENATKIGEEAVQTFLTERQRWSARVDAAKGKLSRFLELCQHTRDVGGSQDEGKVADRTQAFTREVESVKVAMEVALGPLATKVNEADATIVRVRDSLEALREWIEMVRDSDQQNDQKGAEPVAS